MFHVHTFDLNPPPAALHATAEEQSSEVGALESQSSSVHVKTLSFHLQSNIRDHVRLHSRLFLLGLVYLFRQQRRFKDKEKKKKESIFDLSKYIDKPIRVKFQGGREASGVLKGFDPLLNLVLDGTIEYMRDPDDQLKLTEDTRQLGLVVCRGTSVVLICPQDGMEAIPNPFIQQQDG
uniref:U6 snRNA-associated Sm-like protein LSm7 n=1 Tax=Amphiprion percula TaxID=161767 RepID=A0A3P8RL92_AMPPE